MDNARHNWIGYFVSSFEHLCQENGIDPKKYAFSIGDTEHYEDSIELFIRGISRTKKPYKIDETLYCSWIGENSYIEIPGFHMIRKKCSDDRESVVSSEKRISKAIACAVLLGTGITYDMGTFPIPRNDVWGYLLAEPDAQDPDYSFLSLLDLDEEEDCLTGLMYFVNIECQFNMNELSTVHSKEALLKRCRVIAKSLRSQAATPIDYSRYVLNEYVENIMWGKAPSESKNSILSYKGILDCSPREWKETEKLIRFVSGQEDETKYKDYEVPEFSTFVVPEKIQAEIKKLNLKKIASSQMVAEVFQPRTRTEIREEVITFLSKIPESMDVEDMIDAI